jgi:purine-binding chemotaxis protein CheW
MAENPSTDSASCSIVYILRVSVRGEWVGIPAATVIEVLRAVAVTPLPGAPDVISGIINVRGETVVVIDPAVRFGKPEMAIKPTDNLVLVSTPARKIAIRVDIADDLLEIDDSALTTAVEASKSLQKLHGIASMPDGALVIYDVAVFLSQAEEEAVELALGASTISAS